METGTQIMLLREAKGLSREFIADELKMHVNTYKNIEYGKKIPTLKEIEKIAEILEVEPSVFLSADKTTINPLSEVCNFRLVTLRPDPEHHPITILLKIIFQKFQTSFHSFCQNDIATISV